MRDTSPPFATSSAVTVPEVGTRDSQPHPEITEEGWSASGGSCRGESVLMKIASEDKCRHGRDQNVSCQRGFYINTLNLHFSFPSPCDHFTPPYHQVFFEDGTEGNAASTAIAANSEFVADAVRCMPLPISEMPPHAVPLGEERCAVVADESKPDFFIVLTRPCLSLNKVGCDSWNGHWSFTAGA